MIELPDLPGGSGLPSAGSINNRGQISGSSLILTTPSTDRGVIWQDGTVINVGSLSPTDSVNPRCINDAGQLIGHSGITAFIWQNGVMTNFNTLPGAEHIDAVWAINNKGEVAGTIGNPLFQHAVVWSGGTVFDLGDLPGGVGMFLPSGDWSMPSAMNDVGQVVGASDSAAGVHPFLWQNGTMIDLGGTAGSLPPRHGQRHQQPGRGGRRVQRQQPAAPFIWDDKHGLRDLNDLIADQPDGWVLETATAINDLGQIVGEGTHNGQLPGYVLTPLPEPATLVSALLGAVLVSFSCFRGRSSGA